MLRIIQLKFYFITPHLFYLNQTLILILTFLPINYLIINVLNKYYLHLPAWITLPNIYNGITPKLVILILPTCLNL